MGLSPEQRAVVERAAALAPGFAERAPRHDAESSFPIENYRELHAAGLLGLTIPREYGGVGADSLTYALALLEIAKGCPSTALTFNMHATVLTFIRDVGSEEQRRRYFGEVVRNGRLIASITSEPSGTLQSGLETRFRPVDGGYRVRGSKAFCSIGDAADYYLVSGMLEGSTDPRMGLMMAVIPRTEEGVRVERPWNAIGMRGTISHALRYDTIVDRSAVIGRPGQRLGVNERFALGYASTYLGIAEVAFEYILDYARTRVVRPADEPLSHNPLTQRDIAELGTTIRAARLMLQEAATLRDGDDRRATTLAVNQAKYLAGEAGAMVTSRAIRMMGGRGILKDLPLERWHRDSVAGPVMPPSSEQCLETAGRLLCGLDPLTVDYLETPNEASSGG